MTAEVVVMNKLAIALAADSAASITTPTGPKVFNTANKLFALSKFAPVGLLVYNAPEINGVPLEVIVKEYREHIGRKRFQTLKEYVDSFSSFLQDGPPMGKESQEINFGGLVHFGLRQVYLRAVRIRRHDETPSHDFNVYLRRAVDELVKVAKRRGRLKAFEDIDAEKVWKERRQLFSKLHEIVIEQFKEEHEIPDLPGKLRKDIEMAAILVVFSKGRLAGYTGIVIAGYGDKEYFPSYVQYETDGFTPYGLRCTDADMSTISHTNGAELGAFAQREMTQRHLEQ